MTTDIEKSFKAKLRNIAKETNRNPANLWQSVVLERFLVRLGQSAYRNQFVLKGGVLFGLVHQECTIEEKWQSRLSSQLPNL